MIKNNTFSASRLAYICRKEILEDQKTTLLRTVTAYGAMAGFFLWNGYKTYQVQAVYNSEGADPMVSYTLYACFWLALLFGGMAASRNMEKMKSKSGRIATLMTPVSPFEYFASRWLISTILHLAIFLIAFKLADYTRVLTYSLIYPDLTIVPARLTYLFNTNPDYAFFTKSIAANGLVFVAYFYIQSVFILGSSLWPKNSYIKSFTAGFCICIFYIFVIKKSDQLLEGYVFLKDNTPVYGNMLGVHGNPFEQQTIYFLYAFGLFFTLFNWALAYFRFKESEIINRP